LEEQQKLSSSLIESVTVALEFLTILCEEWGCGETRDILASYLDVSLLKKLLKALCSYSGTSCQQLSVVEDAVIAFFRQLCWAHQENSRRFAQILLYVLQPSGSSPTYVFVFDRYNSIIDDIFTFVRELKLCSSYKENLF